MIVTDPIADMLTRIRNALVAKHDTVEVPASNMKKAIAEILLEEGYIKSFEVEDVAPQGIIKIGLKYGPDRTGVIAGLRRISKPGLRVYARKDEVPRVLGGLGIAILSTSQGVMTDKKARQNNIGGEVLAYVW
ncbi:30S ribosomal protein S8 [Christensenella sp. MSJ-20]|uniref:30S ribosomal protein S8 n=1 Tax=Christensenella sp. MSJ-20 TaxID=2841518 RepID=UPI000D7A2D9B|nr:MAG: 30S ribosomal protein S8 [Bacillota bacterium]QWT55126.1 30S ribosomal protein S8 [Christensenella sp. MSJ-20]